PDLAVADLARLRGGDDRVGHGSGIGIVDQDLKTRLGNQVHGVLGAAVDLGVALLAAVAGCLRDRDTLDPHCLDGGADLVDAVRLDDGGDQLHGYFASSYAVSPCSARSMPDTSTSSLTRNPIVYLIASPMIAVATAQ